MMQRSRAMMRQLDSIDSEPARKSYGKLPPTQARMQKSNDLPTNLIFWMEETQDVFPLNQNGAVQFLRKMDVPPVQENVDWVIESLINTPINESVELNGYNVAISCECNHDPGNRTLRQLGIAKSMILKPINRPPTMNQTMTKTLAEEQPKEEILAIIEPKTYGVELGGKIVSGEGVLLGKSVMDVIKIKKKGNVHDDPQVMAHNNMITKAQRMGLQ